MQWGRDLRSREAGLQGTVDRLGDRAGLGRRALLMDGGRVGVVGLSSLLDTGGRCQVICEYPHLCTSSAFPCWDSITGSDRPGHPTPVRR